ncbi:MAG: carbohydrate binding family 9 domain-containing protein, partial [Bacteroidales bacterium]|nr:carbohydrate binding family 9 domain-containing protein [Bacteroidales bacterium]
SIVCKDSDPASIRDILDRRDAISGDMTGIALDSYFDKKTAFEFNLSAAGQKMDLKHLGDYQWDFNWDAVWVGASAKNDSGWVAEMRIPFSQLRYAAEAEHTWGMHVWRWIDRKKEEDQWQYIPLEAPAMVYLFGELKGLKDIRDSRQVEFLPYALTSFQAGVDTKPDPFKGNAGINAKIGIRSDYTLDLAVNPDFGQVEADPAVLNLSSFETFYEEKRPFFLEGNDIFDFRFGDDIPYYSRRIGSAPDLSGYIRPSELSEIPDRTTILSAAKFTGKSKKGLSVGLVNGLTAQAFGLETTETSQEKQTEVAPLSNYIASRIKQEFKNGNSSVGAFFSLVNRFSDGPVTSGILPRQAYTGGIDLLHHWKNRNYFVEFKTIASHLHGSQEAILLRQLSHNHRYQRPDAAHLQVDTTRTRLSGNGGVIRAGKKGGKWNFAAEGHYRSPGLNLNDMGYIGQSDYTGERLEVSYDMNEPTKKIRNYTIEIFQEGMWSFGGERNMNMAGADFGISGIKLWSLAMNFRYNFSSLDPRELRGGPSLMNDPFYLLGISIGSNTAKDLYGRAGFYHNGSSTDHFNHNILDLRLTWLPVRQARLS